MQKLLFVDLSKAEVKEESIDEEFCRKYVGGLGFGAKVLFDRQKAGVDPLAPENMIGFISAPLTGTPALFGCRYQVVAKSPLTETWGEANAGGDVGVLMKFAGYDGVFVTGASEKPVYLFINDGGAEIRDAKHLWGKGAVETQWLLQDELGKKAGVASIGPAGEKLSRIANIMSTVHRSAARSGLGAVMGSKKLKAVAVLGTGEVPLADKEKVNKLRKKYMRGLKGPFIEAVKAMGSSCATAPLTQMGITAVKNFAGEWTEEFPNVAAISDVNILNLKEKSYACYRCPIACHGTMKAGTEYPYGPGTGKPDYEVLAAFGNMCLNDNLESIIMTNEICNHYGIDGISAGCIMAFAIECYENGLITKQDTDGIELTWGNHQAIVAMTEKMAKREGFGAVLADGEMRAAERIGKGAEKFAMHIHGQELPAGSDPRALPSFGVTHMTGAAPGRHMRGGAEWLEMGMPPIPGVPVPGLEKYSFTGKAQMHIWMRNYSLMCDATGLCDLAVFIMAQPVGLIPEQLSAVTGWDYSIEETQEAGDRIANICQAFNVREGLKPSDFKLPGRVIGDPPLTTGSKANITVPVESMAKEYFEARDWDYETGKPSKKKLQELGLVDVAKQIWA